MDGGFVVSEVREMMRKKVRRKRKLSEKKNQPLKVVYISNPMRVHTSASRFRALVQELTGRDAEFPDPAKLPPASLHPHDMDLENDDEQLLLDMPPTEDSTNDFYPASYHSLEDIFTMGIMDNFGATSTSIQSSDFVIGL